MRGSQHRARFCFGFLFVALGANSASGSEIGRPIEDVVRELRKQSCVAVSFIDRRGGETIVIKASSTPEDVLVAIATQTRTYKFETINGRLVLYPIEADFDRELSGISIHAMPRIEAVDTYVADLRGAGILPGLLMTPVVGELRAPLYRERVSVRERGRVIDQMTDLLGSSQMLFFEIPRAPSGRPYIQVESVDCSPKNEHEKRNAQASPVL
jgi:hypothetical protein